MTQKNNIIVKQKVNQVKPNNNFYQAENTYNKKEKDDGV